MTRDAALDAFVADYLTVIGHVLTDHENYKPCRRMDELTDSVMRREVAPAPLLARVVAWTLFTMRWLSGQRELTAKELHIRAAARRLSDAADAAGIEP